MNFSTSRQALLSYRPKAFARAGPGQKKSMQNLVVLNMCGLLSKNEEVKSHSCFQGKEILQLQRSLKSQKS